MDTRIWSRNLKERDNFRNLDVDGRLIIKWILNKQLIRVWSGLNWLMIGSSGGILSTRQ
jgi:hypothetical protein